MTAKTKKTERKRPARKTAAKAPANLEDAETASEGLKHDRVSEEVGGVLLLLGGVLALLALMTFDPTGPNLIGPVGHFVADSALFLLGLAGFALAAVLLIWGVALLIGRRLFTRHREVLGYLLILGIAPPALQMAFATPMFGHPAGGLVGGIVAGFMVAAIGPFGAALCCATTLIVAFMLGVDRSLGELVRNGAQQATERVERWKLERVTRAEARAEARAERDAAKEKAAEAKLADESVVEVEAADEDEADDAVVLDGQDDVLTRRQGLLSRLVGHARSRRIPARDAQEEEFEDAAPVSAPTLSDEPAWAMALSDDFSDDEFTDEGYVVESVESTEPVPAAKPAASRRTPKPTPPLAPVVPASASVAAASDAPAKDADDAPSVSVRPDRSTLSAPAAIGPASDSVHPDYGPLIVESAAQKQRKRAEDLDRAQQVALPLEGSRQSWQLPPLSYLNYDESDHPVDRDKLRELAARLESVLADFKVKGRVSGICPGPVVTLFEFEPESGTKLSRISGLSDDIAMALRAHKVRIIAPIPGKGCVGIEVPNEHREIVYLKEILAADVFTKAKSHLTMALGKDIEGFPVVMDLAKSPHLLVAGTTGSGKSVSVNAMITSVLYNASPDDVRLILIDPKQLEFAIYEGAPHLLLPVVTDPAKAATALNWAVQEMERRYKLMAELKVRNLKGYNEKLAKLHEDLAEERENGPARDEDYVPSRTEAMLLRTDEDGRFSHRRMYQLVVIVDEFADLMMVAGKEVEVAVARLAQKARASGIHCILATQRPSVDVITGLIKANFPTRISFRLMSGTDSRTVLDTIGSENLLGMGDMLYRPPGSSELSRVHGAYVDESEIEQIVAFLAKQRAPEYDESILLSGQTELEDSDEPVDELYDQAVQVVIEAGFASISMVQRKLRIGYNRSARIVEEMERQGLIGPTSGGSSRREVLGGGMGMTI